jgi:c(7)-type cytochrome triheme protein
MKKQLIAFSALVAISAGGTAGAVGPGTILEFGGSDAGVVVFDGTTHQSAGLKCDDCHNPETFPSMRKGAVKITMADMYAGKFCGKCHDGTNAFMIRANCDRCHTKPGA